MVLGILAPAFAQTVPEETQVPILFKLLTYDRTIWDREQETLTLGILFDPEDPSSLRNRDAILEVLRASAHKTINDRPIRYRAIAWSHQDSLSANLQKSPIEVFYVTEGMQSELPGITRFSRDLDILTISGSEAYAESGVSIGLELVNEKPQIEVNLTALADEGHELDSRVLRLCKVVNR